MALPIHTVPFPMYPLLQVHVCGDPMLFVQPAFGWQLPLFLSHSLISINIE